VIAVGDVITKSEFARRAGVEAAAVSAWISRGQLTPPALLEDGRIDVQLAGAQLRERLDPARTTLDFERLLDPDADPSARGGPAALIERAREQRIEENDLRLRRLKREELERARSLVPADAAAQSHARHFEELLTAVEQWLPDLVLNQRSDGLGCRFIREPG
jgi:hypothetical protein